jgi:hypothetical protein
MAPYFARLEQGMLAIAPERNDELILDIFQGQTWHLTNVSGAPVAGVAPFNAVPKEHEIEVSSSGLAMLWCVSAYAALTLDLVRSTQSQRWGETDVTSLFSKMMGFLNYATHLTTHDADWPETLYRPDATARGEPYESINRTFFGAASWILLHEVAHIHLQHEIDLLPPEMIQQEDDADEFAACWVFEKIGYGREREFRILVVGVAVAWLLLFEPIGGDPKHPPAVNRLMRISSFFEAEPESVALEVVSHLLKILFFPAVPAQRFESAQALFDWTVSLFRSPTT